MVVLRGVLVATLALGCFFESDGLQLHFIDEGVGEPVLLIHGFGLDLETCWVDTGIYRALLDAGYRVIAYDVRGHGRSDKPHDPARYGPARARDPIRLLDHLGIKRAHVIGYSMGARIASQMRANHPDRLLSVTLGGFGEDGRPVEPDPQRFDVANALEQGNVEPFLRRFRLTTLSAEKVEAMSRWLAAHNDLHALAASMRSEPFQPVPLSNLRSNRVPALAVVGDLDPARQRVEAMKNVMSNLEVVVLANDDHLSALTDARFTEALLAFLERAAPLRDDATLHRLDIESRR